MHREEEGVRGRGEEGRGREEEQTLYAGMPTMGGYSLSRPLSMIAFSAWHTNTYRKNHTIASTTQLPLPHTHIHRDIDPKHTEEQLTGESSQV